MRMTVARSAVVKRLALAIALAAIAAGTARGQQMPDPSQMAGRPLPAPELPTGTISVRLVRERMGNNITNHPVTVTAGERTLTGTTDAQGRAQFGDIPAGTVVSVEAVVDGEALRSQSFPVPETGGVRVALIAGLEAAAARERTAADAAARQPARAGVVVFGGETRIILEFQDDNLQVFYLLDIVNNARTPIDIGEPLLLQLPEGATGAGTMQGSSSHAMLQGDRLRISGPFPPGTTSVQLGFRLPYRGDRATLTQRWPAALEQVFVATEKIGHLEIASPQFASQQEASASGTPFLMATGGRINAGDTLTLTLTGLPARSRWVRDVGVTLGLVVLLVGLWAGVRGVPGNPGAVAQLKRRKEKLFAELVVLEEQQRRGRIDEARYAAKRRTLVSQLERVMAELDGTTAGEAA